MDRMAVTVHQILSCCGDLGRRATVTNMSGQLSTLRHSGNAFTGGVILIMQGIHLSFFMIQHPMCLCIKGWVGLGRCS